MPHSTDPKAPEAALQKDLALTPERQNGGELTRTQEDLRNAHIVESSADMITRQTAQGLFLYVSRACESLLGYAQTELVGRSFFDFLHPEDVEEIRGLQSMLMEQRGASTLSYRIRRKNGIYVWFETTSRAIRISGVVDEIVNVSREITDRKRAEEQIEHQVYHDPLTDLPNRILLEDRAAIALARSKRNESPMALLFVDLNRFKQVNDTFGHAIGDELLQLVARRLGECVREIDTVARIGGDEFVILLDDMHDTKDSAKVAKKIIAALDQPFSLDSHEIHIGASIGIALYPFDGADVETLLRCADLAMYRAKLLGGSAYEMHTAAMSAQAAEVFALEADLRHAIERRELQVVYQPQLDLRSGKIVALEALVRWPHSTRGLLMPDTFVPLAEESKLIIDLGCLVLERACRDLQQWRSKGLGQHVRVAVNLSAIQFQDHRLVETIRTILADSDLPAPLLELEITESTLMVSAEQTLEHLKRLKEMNVQLAIDDFGMGYSSLSYLKQFPVDAIKIDRSFVSGIDGQGCDTAIIAAVVGLARALGLRVVAEGVETEQQAVLLKSENCDLAQGFFFSLPVEALAVEDLLRRSVAAGFVSPAPIARGRLSETGFVNFCDTADAGPISGTLIPPNDVIAHAFARQFELQEIQLLDSSRARDEFLSTLSHELRTPLTAILGWSHLLLQGDHDAETIRGGLEAISESANAQRQLVDDILYLSRITTGKLTMHGEVIDLARIASLAIDSVRFAAAALRVEIHTAFDDGAFIFGDADRLQRVVRNLLTNAIKFSSRDTVVRLQVSHDAVNVTLRVTDTGRGISREFLPHVFEAFRQADASDTRAPGSIGLGLSIVKHLVEVQGGSVEAQSEGVGRGASFLIRFPLLRRFPEPHLHTTFDGDEDGALNAA